MSPYANLFTSFKSILYFQPFINFFNTSNFLLWLCVEKLVGGVHFFPQHCTSVVIFNVQLFLFKKYYYDTMSRISNIKSKWIKINIYSDFFFYQSKWLNIKLKICIYMYIKNVWWTGAQRKEDTSIHNKCRSDNSG